MGKIAELAKCQVTGRKEVNNNGHRLTLATLIHALEKFESVLLCELSQACKTTRPPDIVLIDSGTRRPGP